MTLGYIAAFSETLALAVVVSKGTLGLQVFLEVVMQRVFNVWGRIAGAGPELF